MKSNTKFIGAYLTLLAALGATAGGAAIIANRKNAKPQASLEQIAKTQPRGIHLPDERIEDGWYIQYSFNTDLSFFYKNKDFLKASGFSNVYRKDEYREGKYFGTRTLVGKYSSLDDAVQEADKFSDFAEGLEEAGIIRVDKGHATWTDSVPLFPKKRKVMPSWLKQMIAEEVNLYNSTEGYVDRKRIESIAQRENPDFDPNAKSYKVKRVKNRNPKTNKIRPYILVYKTDSYGNKIPSGAQGLMMVTPESMAEVGLDPSRINDPRMNVRAGIRYYGKWLKILGNDTLAAIAYNGGPSRAKMAMGILPQETREYVSAVSQNYQK